MQLFKTDVLKKEYKSFTNSLLLEVMKSNYGNILSCQWHKKIKLECSQCRQSHYRDCYAFNTSRNYLLENLDDMGKEYLNNYIVDFLNVSDELLNRYFKDIKPTIIDRSKTYNVQSFRKSEKNSSQVVYQTLENCEKICYQVGNKKRKYYKKSKLLVFFSITKTEKWRVPKLYALVANEVYYFNLNTAYMFSKYCDWYCRCSEFSGCPFKNGQKLYCYCCQLEQKYNHYKIELSFSIKFIIKTNISLKKDLKEYSKFDPTTNFFWLDDYTNKTKFRERICISTLRDFVNNHPKTSEFY